MAFVPHAVAVDGPEATTDVLVLHGILGSGRNLRSFARLLQRARPSLRFWLVDLRNHGDSQGAPPPHTIAACCDDLDALCAARGLAPAWVIGHSYGGKVAVAWAGRAPPGLSHVFVLDAPPAAYPLTDLERGDPQDHVERVIRCLRQVPQPLTARQDVVAELRRLGLPDSVGDWMTTNLRHAPDGYRWVFDLDAIDAMLASYLHTDTWPVLEAPPPGVRVDVIRAARSQRWNADVLARFAAIRHGRTRLHTMPDVGHWLHVEQPEALARLLLSLA